MKNYRHQLVIDFCQQLQTNDQEYLENAKYNQGVAETGATWGYTGCPRNYGLDPSDEICGEDLFGHPMGACEKCWARALW